MDSVKMRPLRWESDHDEHTAETIFGRYTVSLTRNAFRVFLSRTVDGRHEQMAIKEGCGFEDGKEAARIDYEQRHRDVFGEE